MKSKDNILIELVFGAMILLCVVFYVAPAIVDPLDSRADIPSDSAWNAPDYADLLKSILLCLVSAVIICVVAWVLSKSSIGGV